MPVAAPKRIEGVVRHFAAQRSGKIVLHSLGALGIHWCHLLPRHAKSSTFCVEAAVAAGSVPVTTAFEAVVYPRAPAVGVADAGVIPVALLRVC